MCRDCRTCTQPGAVRLAQDWTAGIGHVMSIGISFAVKRGGFRHCPQCKHLLGRHQTRADGSFRD